MRISPVWFVDYSVEEASGVRILYAGGGRSAGPHVSATRVVCGYE
jgi:hypothetical protein